MSGIDGYFPKLLDNGPILGDPVGKWSGIVAHTHDQFHPAPFEVTDKVIAVNHGLAQGAPQIQFDCGDSGIRLST